MAGYMLYSLDWGRFQQFCTDPNEQQMLQLAEEVSVTLDDRAGDLEDEDVLKTWPVEPVELVSILRERMTSEDWFRGLSDLEKDTFDFALRGFFSADNNCLDFRCESDDGVYWDVIDLVRKSHSVPLNTVNEKIISQFGTKPLYCTLEAGKIPGLETWAPYHSMHPPEDVKKLRDEVLAAEAMVMDSDDENAKQEYKETLVPTLDRLAEQNRLLFVVLDT